MSVRRRLPFVSLLPVLIAVLALSFSAPAAQASLDTVTGGQFALFVPLSNVNKLGQDGIYTSPISPAFLTFTLEEGPAVRFPISGGAVESDTMLGTVNSDGGLSIQKHQPVGTIIKQLDITNMKIVNGNMLIGQLQGLIPAPSANLINATHSKDPETGVIHYEADAQVDAGSALILNTYFETTVFEANMILGHVKGDIQTQPAVPLESGGYPRPKGATPFRASLAPAYRPCTTPDDSHGEPLSFPSCSPPVEASDFLTVGTPDANGAQANSVGSVTLKVLASPDVSIDASLTDVRSKGDLSDYTGELQARLPVQITDRLNGALQNDPATGETTVAVSIPCAETADADLGADCSVSTTMNAITPGSVVSGSRSVWELNNIKVLDGGPDGTAATPDNTLFASQAVFVP
jgi:hypothetical protein